MKNVIEKLFFIVFIFYFIFFISFIFFYYFKKYEYEERKIYLLEQNLKLFGEICYNKGYLSAKKGIEYNPGEQVEEVFNKIKGEFQLENKNERN